MRRGRTITTPYGKKVKVKARPKKAEPLPPSPYIWVQLPFSVYKKTLAFGPLAIRKKILAKMKEEGGAISGLYFKQALDDCFEPNMVIVRGDKRFRSLSVIGRTDSEGAFHNRSSELDISSRIED